MTGNWSKECELRKRHPELQFATEKTEEQSAEERRENGVHTASFLDGIYYTDTIQAKMTFFRRGPTMNQLSLKKKKIAN